MTLDEIIDDIENLRPLPMSQEMEELLNQVVRCDQPKNIEKWAEQLAWDVVEAND